MSASLRVGLLGPLEVRRDGDAVEVAAPKQRALVALLALDVGKVVSTDELVDRLWAGEAPASASTALQVYVSQLRKLLGADAIVTRRPGYVLDIPADGVDAVPFERLVGDGRALLASGDAEGAVAVLTEALSTWRGSALAEFVYEDWAAAAARRWEELRLVALEDRVDAELALGHGPELTGELEGLAREHPLRERFRGQQMLALYRAGRQADALSAYQDARRALVEELGIDPSPALIELERRILQQDPTLDPPARESVDARPAGASRSSPSASSVETATPVPRDAEWLECERCGARVGSAASFCSECGEPLAPAPTVATRQQRKLVTALFCDLVGSTALGDRMDAEVVRRVMDRYFDAASAVISRHGGSVEKFIGDAVVAVFGVPKIHEDDALRAARAAGEIRTAVAVVSEETNERWGVRLRTRIGINTGEVIVGAGYSVATGDAVNLAARLEQAAEPDEILLGDASWQLIHDAVVAEPVEPLSVRGKAEKIGAHRLIEVIRGAAGHARRLDLPLVGRKSEQRLLRESYDRFVAERACGIVTVLGNAGVGKSRLVAEVLGSLQDQAQIVSGRCLPYGSGITYWPMAEAIRQLAGVDEQQTVDEVKRRLAELTAGAARAETIVAGVAALIGVEGATTAADEAKWAVRLLFEQVASDRPLVVVVDDLQWAEAPLLDLIDYLADTTNAPVVLLCVARPDLLDLRRDWGGGKLNATTVLLEPLDPAHSDVLMTQLLGGRRVPDELRVRVAAAAAGNPLFAEELLAYLQERGHITMTDDSVEVATTLDDVEIPPTIRALIGARLDQLPERERGVLERGAVEGEVFHGGTIGALAGEGGDSRPDGELQRLVRKQVLRPDRALLPGEDAYRFRHLLIRDATYDAIPKQQRAEWHRMFADWLEATVGPRVSEYEEILAYHYAAACRYQTDLGAGDAEPLRDRAAELLRRSADRALIRGDPANAVVVLAQLVDVLPESHDDRVVAMSDLAGAFRALYRIEDADRVGQQATREGGAASPESNAYAQAAALPIASDVRTTASAQSMLADATRMAEEAEGADWHGVASLAWIAVAEATCGLHHAEEMVVAAERARTHARAAEMPWLEAEADRWEALSLVFGSMPVDQAIQRCRALYPEDSAERLVVARGGMHVATLLCSQGRVAPAMRLLEEARGIFSDLGIASLLTDWWRGIMLFEAGRAEEAVPHLIESTMGTFDSGDPNHASTSAAAAAHALAQVGRYDEVGQFVDMARDWAGPDDLSTHMLWRGALARVRAAAGAAAEAGELAREAAQMAAGTDFASAAGLALIDLAWVSMRIGELDQARDAAERAVELLRRRGAVPLCQQAEAILADVEAARV